MRLPASLTSRLVVTAVTLVVLVTVFVGAVTALAMRAYLTNQLDQDVAASLMREQRGPDGPEDPPRDGPGRDGPGRAGDFVGEVGSLSVHFSDGRPARSLLIAEADRSYFVEVPLDDAVVDQIAALPADGRIRSVDLEGLGSYRVVVDDDRSVAVGLPSSDVADAVTALVVGEGVLVVLGGVVAALVGRSVVRRQLRPLTEVAETAHTVAALPLASGAIGLTERVPAHLTDERTEVGRVGAALNTLLAHVETSLDARHASEQRVRQFVADASHELRTPLTTIAGYTELARNRPDDAAASRTALDKVADESERMTALVEDLLLLARLDSGRPLERRRVDLSRLLVEAVSDARVVGADHRWRLELPDHAIEVTGDEQRLHQVATNLLANARTHTPSGTTVSVTGRADGFSVHDDGPGFPPELVPHAFERFVRADAARQREGGVGLGLALVEAIVTAHGGRVALVSEPGATRIDVHLDR